MTGVNQRGKRKGKVKKPIPKGWGIFRWLFKNEMNKAYSDVVKTKTLIHHS